MSYVAFVILMAIAIFIGMTGYCAAMFAVMFRCKPVRKLMVRWSLDYAKDVQEEAYRIEYGDEEDEES